MNRRQMMTAATVAALGLPTVARAVEPMTGRDGAAGTDPALAAFVAWRVAQEAADEHLTRTGNGDHDGLDEVALQARRAACEAVATTAAGMVAQLALAFDMFGDRLSDGAMCSPEGYRFGAWSDDIDGALLRNLFTAAQSMAACDAGMTPSAAA